MSAQSCCTSCQLLSVCSPPGSRAANPKAARAAHCATPPRQPFMPTSSLQAVPSPAQLSGPSRLGFRDNGGSGLAGGTQLGTCYLHSNHPAQLVAGIPQTLYKSVATSCRSPAPLRLASKCKCV